jgi:DNA polymerase (family 10)
MLAMQEGGAMGEQSWPNEEIVVLLRRFGDMLDIAGDDRFRVQAYRRAADNIETLGEQVAELWSTGDLRSIPGVGDALARKLDELLRTGRMAAYERLRAEVPQGVVDLLQIPDVGPRTARLLWLEGGLCSLADVRDAAEAGRLRDLPGLGARSEANILAGVRSVLCDPPEDALGG